MRIKFKPSLFSLQVIAGIPGLKPSEVVIEFVSSSHSHFTGGIFFVNATNNHFMTAAEEKIKTVSHYFLELKMYELYIPLSIAGN